MIAGQSTGKPQRRYRAGSRCACARIGYDARQTSPMQSNRKPR